MTDLDYENYSKLEEKFIEISKFYNLYKNYSSAVFHFILSNHEFSQANTIAQWNTFHLKYFAALKRKNEKLELSDVQVCTEVIIRLLRLPATEAVAESVFSHLDTIFPKSRASFKEDLLESPYKPVQVNDY